MQVRDLRIDLVASGEDIVEAIAMDVRAGEVLGLVGESGSGKTTVGMALLGYCRPGGKVTGGEILIDGRPLAAMAANELRRLRGGTVSYIPQDPGTALNPRIGGQLSEMLEAHRSETSAEDQAPHPRDARGVARLHAFTPVAVRGPAAAIRDGVRVPPSHVIVCDEPTWAWT